MVIHPGIPESGVVNSHNDHRIAMALATLGLNAKGDITIENAECISKSYPEYFNDYEKLKEYDKVLN
jgi:3-phosphoshikimate 1-carboxyvinyltransferase